MNNRAERKAGWLLSLSMVSAICMQPYLVSTPAVAKGSIHNSSSATVEDQTIDGKPHTVSKIVVKARPEQVWHILTDYNNAAHVFPQMKKCQLLEDKGTTKIVKHVVTPSGPVGTFEYTIEIKETAPKELEWHRISGAFKAVDGHWKLEPLDSGRSTLVTYASHVNGGFFLPQPLIKRQCHADMPAVLVTLKHRAETTGHIAGVSREPNQ